jgi:L-arabinose isomerase
MSETLSSATSAGQSPAMFAGRRTKVGLLGLMLELYDLLPELKPTMAAFAGELVEALAPFADVTFPGVCNTREQVDRAVAGFEADGTDLIMVVLLTYAPSHIALPALCRTRLPILIFNTQKLYGITKDVLSDETTENHGMHGVQDLANVLLRAGREFQIVTGHYRDKGALTEVRSWCDAVRTAAFMRHVRIGLLGYPMEGMGDFGLDDTAFLAQTGVEVHHLAMKVVAERAQAAPPDAIGRQMAEDRQNFLFEEGITEAEHEASSRLEWALREILQERGMHGFSSHFMAVGEEDRLDTLPFLAASKLLGEGYGFGGEGDASSTTAVVMMRELAGAANFTEMFCMDFARNAVLMMHMGEGNWRMARRYEPVHLLRSTLGLVDLRVAPLLLAFSLEPGDVTLVSLTTLTGGKLKLIVAEGEVLDFPYVPDLGRPHYKFRPSSGDLCDFLTRFSREGGSHHQALAYGHWANTVEKIAILMGIECARV